MIQSLNRQIRVLLVDDDEDDFILTRDLLSDGDGWTFHLEWSAVYEDAREIIRENRHEVYLIDYRLGEKNGLQLLRDVVAEGNQTPIILLTGQGDRAIDLDAMQAGAVDYLTKGQLHSGALERAIRYATERKRAEEYTRILQQITEGLSQAVTVQEVAGVILERGLKALEAHLGSVSLVSVDGQSLEMLYQIGLSVGVVQAFRTVPLDSSTPLSEAAATAKPVWIETYEAYIERYPQLASVLENTGSKATACLPMIINEKSIGGIGISFPNSMPMTQHFRNLMLAISRQCAQAMERARLYELEQNLRHTAEAAQQRLELLAEASRILGSSLDYQHTLQNIAQLCVPGLADWCTVHLISEEKAVPELVAIAHQDAEKLAWVQQFRNEYPYDTSNERGLAKVLQTGKAEVYPEIKPELLQTEQEQSLYGKLNEQIPLKSVMLVPLSVRDRVIGMITLLMAESGRIYERDTDLSLVEEIARRMAVAIDNARLLETARVREKAEREQRALAEALSDISIAINSTLNLSDVLDRLLESAGRVIPHDTANIMLITDGEARVVRSRGYDNRLGIDLEGTVFPMAERATLRLMRDTLRPLIVKDTRDYPEWVSVPVTNHIRSYAGVPIVVRDKTIGFLNLDSMTPGFFNESYTDRLQALASHAALAIFNAQLYQEAQMVAVFEERQRLARDLHDAISQTLFSSSLIAEALPVLAQRSPARVEEQLEQLQRLNRGALAEMRNLLLELRPEALQKAEIHELMIQLVQAFKGRAKADFTVEVAEEVSLPLDVKIMFYRIAQEALNNVMKHSQASEVVLSFTREAQNVTLTIRDNGQGFDGNHRNSNGLGLNIMRERAEAVNASFDIHSSADNGTSIRVVWPYVSHSEPASN